MSGLLQQWLNTISLRLFPNTAWRKGGGTSAAYRCLLLLLVPLKHPPGLPTLIFLHGSFSSSCLQTETSRDSSHLLPPPTK